MEAQVDESRENIGLKYMYALWKDLLSDVHTDRVTPHDERGKS